jgi:hypothetical protein
MPKLLLNIGRTKKWAPNVSDGFSLRRRATAEFSPVFQGRGKKAASSCVASRQRRLSQNSIVAKATAANLVISPGLERVITI